MHAYACACIYARALINFRQCQIVSNAALTDVRHGEALQLRFLTHLSAFSAPPDGVEQRGAREKGTGDRTAGALHDRFE